MGRRHLCSSRHACRFARSSTVRVGRRHRRRHPRLHGRLNDHLPFGLCVLHGLAAVVRNGTNGRGAIDRTNEGRILRRHHQQRPAIPGLPGHDRARRPRRGHRVGASRQALRGRDEFLAAVHDHTQSRTTAQLLEEAALLRIPAAPVLDAAGVLAFEHFRDREVFLPSPSGRFVQPRVPYRVSGRAPRPFSRAPAPGEHDGAVDWPDRGSPPRSAGERQLPLTGIRVVDCTAWWAGPSATNVLAALGADVVKVESVDRPDQMRFSSTRRPPAEDWWEWGPIFHAVNTGKRGITIDLGAEDGIAVFRRLLRSADVFVENYTPRVMDQFGLTWDSVHELNPELIMVRMPAFGLDGPWRDRTGFAQTMESVSGMAWRTGREDGPPTLVRGACDPIAGMHTVLATLLALIDRDRSGRGSHVESVMVEAALNVAAEQVIEYSAAGQVMGREGNRGPAAAPQGVYRCSGDDRWVAIAVETDRQWSALVRVTGSRSGRRRATSHRRQGVGATTTPSIATWRPGPRHGRPRTSADLLSSSGVPAELVIAARDIASNPQLQFRGLFETEDHPVTGAHPIPMLPFRFLHVPRWLCRPSPSLGTAQRRGARRTRGRGGREGPASEEWGHRRPNRRLLTHRCRAHRTARHDRQQ